MTTFTHNNLDVRNRSGEYSVMFETETGMEMFSKFFENRTQVRTYLRNNYPDDIGADGEITDPEGEDYPIEW